MVTNDESLFRHPKLQFTNVILCETEDRIGRPTAYYGPLKFQQLSNKKWLISGSLHYFYNFIFNPHLHYQYRLTERGGYNGNDFNIHNNVPVTI